jgi:cell division protein FtsL
MTRSRAQDSRLRMNARLVREKDRAKARDLRRFVLYGAAIVAPLLVYVWQRVDFLRLSHRVEVLQEQKQDLAEINKRMAVERSLLMSPGRIERVARQQLGLVDPQPEDVRRVAATGGVPGEIGGPVTSLPADGSSPAPARPASRRPARRYSAASAGAFPLPQPRRETQLQKETP